ncbi:hypothetical protein [Bifidobacterium avesanii]|uniref:CTP synthase n=1 Tax=Bifidobacterium avesanii TaxID=1798157 RepID=A0A7K3TJ41_9BIFI|nr:hypothetical protein [Bifidobacterium avesanii]KAB8293580.1 CTP synthase [Bifidobacterium avesanii]NEG78283.1 hypothetical protein [Bifidobacterium avesanii]
MRSNPRIERLLDESQRDGHCAVGLNPADRRGLALRARNDALVMPYRGIYARRDRWDALTPIERTLHAARALAILHPRWVFAGPTAAAIHGYDHSYALHADGAIHIASPRSSQSSDCSHLIRIPMRKVPTVQVNGLRVTDPVRTLMDCGARYSFQDALPIFDAAARLGVDLDAVRRNGAASGLDSGRISRVCDYADPLSENGGESTIRALIISNGFLIPQLQRPFNNPDNPMGPYRTDFSWHLSQGLIVAEYDGMEKYVMQQGSSRRTIQAAVHAERRREDHLRAQGVTVIVRLEYEDILHPERLVQKLLEAGIPRSIR